MVTELKSSEQEGHRWPTVIVAAVFLTIAAFFLMFEHRAHLFGALPWVLLAICLAIVVGVWFIDRYQERQTREAIERRLRARQGGQSHGA